MNQSYGPQTEAADNLHQMKYRSEGENFREAMNRMAGTLADDDNHFRHLQRIFGYQYFLGGGRTQSAVGSTRSVTAINCFVMPDIIDSYTDGDNCIMDVARKAAATMRMGGGVGYNFGTLRPKGDLIKKLDSYSSGPVSFMRIFNEVCLCTSSAGHRRGAQMGIMPCLVGETKVHTLNHGRVPIKDLVGTQPYLYVIKDGRVAVEKALSVFSSGFKKTITVYLDNDTQITCTPDHKFMLSTGIFVEAKNLVAGSSLMAFKKQLDERGYLMVGCTGTHARHEHRVVYESVKGSIPSGYHIHHIDHSKTNNSPENLECLSKTEHGKIHGWTTLESHQIRVTKNRKGKTLEEWLGVDRALEVRSNMSKGQSTRFNQLPVWNKNLTDEEYKNYYPNGFSNQYTKVIANHKVLKIEFHENEEEVFDITMPSTHNFIAEEVCVHNCWHPDIVEFIHAKQDNKSLTGFNISVAVTDEFMNAVEKDTGFDLRFNDVTYRTIRARDLWEQIMRSTWDWAEPGIIFIDRINKMNNLWYCEQINATNPCGEQPLPPNGACLLGSFNLVKYLKRNNLFDFSFNYDQFISDIPHVVRAMDNIIDHTIYPLPDQAHEEKTKRRMGLGITGLANTIEALGYPYGSEEFLATEKHILTILRNQCYSASVQLAKEKGPFEAWEPDQYVNGQFIKQLPYSLYTEIEKYGIRNSHLLSIAPTGTISMCADNVSSGLEPVFAYSLKRNINTPSGSKEVTIEDYGMKFLGVRGRLASQVTADEHLNVLATAQDLVDSAVSKTVNMDHTMSWHDFKELYIKAWKLGCKGLSTFNSSGKRTALLTSTENEQSCKIDLETGRRECG